MSQTQRAFHVPGETFTEPQQLPVQKPVVITRHISRGEKMLWLMSGIIFFLLAAWMVTNQARMFLVSRDIQNLQDKRDAQVKVTQQLKAEVDDLSSPERIVQFAEKELNLKLDVNHIKILP